MTFWFSRPGQEALTLTWSWEAAGPRQNPPRARRLSQGTTERGSGGIRAIRDCKQVKARGGGYREQG